MLEKLQMYINGEWVDSHSTETIEVMNPSDDSVLGMIAAGNSDDVDKAVAAAKEAFDDFSFSTKEERVQILENIIVKDKSVINKAKCKSATKKAHKLMGRKGRILVRKSGTEPKIRVMAESYDKSLIFKCIKIIKKSIR